MCDTSMGTNANLKSKFPSRYVTGGPEGAPYCSCYVTAGLTGEQIQHPCIADLKPAGRYVAKDLFEAGGVPLLAALIGVSAQRCRDGRAAETLTYADL